LIVPATTVAFISKFCPGDAAMICVGSAVLLAALKLT
jgi:hypothetical protein